MDKIGYNYENFGRRRLRYNFNQKIYNFFMNQVLFFNYIDANFYILHLLSQKICLSLNNKLFYLKNKVYYDLIYIINFI